MRAVAIIVWASLGAGCAGQGDDSLVRADAGESGADLGAAHWARATGTVAPGLAIRLAPQPGAEEVGILPEGCVASLTGKSEGDWFEIEYDGTIGWSHSGNLELMTKHLSGCESSDDGGDGGAEPEEEVDPDRLLLPWDAGDAYTVSQANGNGHHSGIDEWAWDFEMGIGAPVLAARGGTVRKTRGDSSLGGCSSDFQFTSNYVVIDHGDGTESLYTHLDFGSVTVSPGEAVQRGQHIADSGASGWTCAPLLHFQVQISPSAGGRDYHLNQSVKESFYDSGTASALSKGEAPRSANRRP